MPRPLLSADHIAEYQRDGYYIVRGLFDKDETQLLHRIALADQALASAGAMADAQGGQSKIWLTNELSDSMYAAVAQSHRVVDRVEQLLGGEALHFHHKMMLKEPRVGGAWEWHQDYGYWYNNTFLFPHLLSCMIAVDRATKANGCLQVLRGSHLLGRIEHGRVGAQVGADVNRVNEAAKVLDTVYCEMEPGDALFFHCNLLHASSQNHSDYARWSLICCYTRGDNRPYDAAGRAWASAKPFERLSDERFMEIGRKHWEAMQAAATA